ncbi:MAG: cytochrome b562 [Akkermansiaceae bacterium]|nr:cytochrome b562 [Akkermansiaceae bacterium]
MKARLILMTMAACLVLPVSAEEETQLGKQMEEMNDAYKVFRRETDPVKGAALAREAQQAIVKSFSEIPTLVTKMPDGPDKAKASAEYRKMMGQLYVALCEVEQAFLNGKVDEVATIVERLKEMKKTGHEKFMEDE